MSNKEIVIADVADKYENPIAELVQVACKFDSEIILESNNRKINAKSIMGMMSLNLSEGTAITVAADGEDESEAVAGVEAFLVANK